MRWIIVGLIGLAYGGAAFAAVPRNEIFLGKFDGVEYGALLPAIPKLVPTPQDKRGWILGYQFASSEPVSGLVAMLGVNALRYEEPEQQAMLLSAYASFRLMLGRFLFLHPYLEGSVKGPTLFYDKEGGARFGLYQEYAAVGCSIGASQVLALSVRVYRYYENKEEILYTTPYVFSASLCF